MIKLILFIICIAVQSSMSGGAVKPVATFKVTDFECWCALFEVCVISMIILYSWCLCEMGGLVKLHL